MISRDGLQQKFRSFILLSFFVLVIEIFGGILSNSLSLLSDSGHVLIDLLALLLTYFSIKLSRRKSTKKFTYGFYRAEIFAAIINGMILVFATLFIFYQSYLRFLSPKTINGTQMIFVAAVGLAANIYVAIKMKDYAKEHLNVKSAYLHVLSDTLSSVGVVIAGILIIVTGNYVFDPIMSAIIGVFILVSSLKLIFDSLHILMEGTPRHVDIEKLARDIKSVRGVKEVHDIHVWSISSDVYALSSHILINARDIKSMNKIVARVNEMLKQKYKITHTAIQSECENCISEKSVHKH